MSLPDQEPDNPAAYALAQHIADHPVSTVQAAFRYLNAPLTLELHEDPAPAAMCELPHQSVDEEEECEEQRVAADTRDETVSPAYARLQAAAHEASEAAHLHAMHGMKRVFQLCRRYGDQMIPTAWVLDALGLDENANTTIDLTTASDTEPSGRDALMQAHTALATQSARDQATLGRLRHLHDSLAGESTLSGPDDLITQGSAARRIATALDGPNPAELPSCDAEFEGGGHCAKPVGHRPPGSDDPHVPATATCGHTKSTNGAVYPPCGRAPGHQEAYCYSADGSAYFIALHRETAHGEQPQPQKDDA